MAARKESAKSTNTQERKHHGLGCLFWIAFVLLIISLFLINKPIIEKNLGTFLEPFKKTITTDSPPHTPEISDGETQPAPKSAPSAPPAKPTAAPVPHTPAIAETSPASSPIEEPTTTPQKPKPAAATETSATEVAPQKVAPEPKKPAIEVRERSLWLVRLDGDGTLVRTKITRSLPASDSPLTDALKALLAGPLPSESAKGLSSLIPSNTELLSVIVRGNTAYISLSEEYQFNTYGIEGYAAQLKQIVWTATEFPNVKDVQILIEGRRVDYLGSEGIFIGSPLSRDSL